jgi:hypothetical protein
MLDGGGTEAEIHGVCAAVDRETAWMALHQEILSVRQRRTALEAREIELLLDAEETRLFRRFGYTSIYAYIEAELGYSHHAATERMRVGHELHALPNMHDAFHDGELTWSCVRELTRIVTPETEIAWLDAVEDKRADQVQRMVRGKSRGDLPTDPSDPRKIRHRIVLDGISEETFMAWKQARVAAAAEAGGSVTDDQLARALAKAALEPAAAERPAGPRFMSAVVTCRACRETTIVGAGIEVPVSAARAERVACDCVHAGDLDTCELTKPVGCIPAALRRKVWIRDKGQCVGPGCRSCRYLEVHHIIWREHGGWNCITNLVLICDAHHAQIHDGLLVITGRAPDLVFETRVSPSWD